MCEVIFLGRWRKRRKDGDAEITCTKSWGHRSVPSGSNLQTLTQSVHIRKIPWICHCDVGNFLWRSAWRRHAAILGILFAYCIHWYGWMPAFILKWNLITLRMKCKCITLKLLKSIQIVSCYCSLGLLFEATMIPLLQRCQEVSSRSVYSLLAKNLIEFLQWRCKCSYNSYNASIFWMA